MRSEKERKENEKKNKENDSMEAYVCFVDFEKAYDRVAHEAMLYKLRRYGICGKTYKFIEKLYANSKMCVRVGRSLSRVVCLKRGLRQGCPLSPILFLIFINDIVKPVEKKRVWDPSMEGLMFADDICVFSRTEGDLRELMDGITDWANRWEMKIGSEKCGVMKVGGGGLEEIKEKEWRLEGKLIPCVSEYRYLGLVITEKLEMKRMVEERVERARKTLDSLRVFLDNHNIPVPLRLRAINSLLLPACLYGSEIACLYGSEIWGGVREYGQLMQVVLNDALRIIITENCKTCIPNEIMYLELDEAPLVHVALKKRMGVSIYGGEWSHVLGELMNSLDEWKSLSDSFLKNTGRIGSRCLVEMDKRREESMSSGRVDMLNDVVKKKMRYGDYYWKVMSSDDLNSVVMYLWINDLRKVTKRGKEYLENGRFGSRLYWNVWMEHPELGRGCQKMLEIRCGGWEGGDGEWRWKDKFDESGKGVCPCCMKNVEDTLEHYMCECKGFEKERNEIVLWVKDKLIKGKMDKGIVECLESRIVFGIALGMRFSDGDDGMDSGIEVNEKSVEVNENGIRYNKSNGRLYWNKLLPEGYKRKNNSGREIEENDMKDKSNSEEKCCRGGKKGVEWDENRRIWGNIDTSYHRRKYKSIPLGLWDERNVVKVKRKEKDSVYWCHMGTAMYLHRTWKKRIGLICGWKKKNKV